MIFARKNFPLVDCVVSDEAHFYFLHHQHEGAEVLFSGPAKDFFFSIQASLIRNKKVFLFDKEFDWPSFQAVTAKSSINHFIFSEGVLLLLPSLKNRISTLEKSSGQLFTDLALFAQGLKLKI